MITIIRFRKDMLNPKDPFSKTQEARFLAWIRTLPSCLDGNTPCEACHVRRVSQGAGIGIKPKLFAVPMTVRQHAHQHRHGEFSVLMTFGRVGDKSILTAEQAKLFFTRKAFEYRERFLAMEVNK